MSQVAQGADQTGGELYQRNEIAYLEKLRKTFGEYKRRSFEFLQPTPGLKVLDVGCGTGEDVLALRQILGAAGRAVGVDKGADKIATACRQAAAAGIPAEFFEGDAYSLPFPDGTFDRCRADRVFQHLSDPMRALREMQRVLVPGGLVMLLDVDWATVILSGSDLALTTRLLSFQFSQQVNGAAGRYAWKLFHQAGLRDIEIYAQAFPVTDWEIANFTWGLSALAKRAAEAGVVTPAESEGWLRDLEAQGRAGEFFGSMTGFVIRGRKPA